jgi:lactate racemase
VAKLNIVRVNQLAWYGDTELELQFPQSWEINVCNMRGCSAPPLSDEQIKQAFANPIGTKQIRELAQGKKEVVIIFDDITRPTKVFQLVPHVLKELQEAGIQDGKIRFIAALGAHGAMKRMEFAKKLGEEVISRFDTYNHNCYANCTYLGQTSRGTPVNINSEVMACDLKISISGVCPHPRAGFSGGAKAILPGVSHIDSIRANHLGNLAMVPINPDHSSHRPINSPVIDKVDNNAVRLDMEEIARMAGLDFSINVVFNGKRNPSGLFVGDVVAAHRRAVKFAREMYATPPSNNVDIVILNNYSKPSEPLVIDFNFKSLLKGDGGILVIIANAPDGQVTHYLLGDFGKSTRQSTLPPGVNKIIMLTEYPEATVSSKLGPPQSIFMVKTWSEVINLLRVDHNSKAKVAVFPDVALQLLSE